MTAPYASFPPHTVPPAVTAAPPRSPAPRTTAVALTAAVTAGPSRSPAPLTPAAAVTAAVTAAGTAPPLPDIVTQIMTADIVSDAGAFAALIGGVVGALLLLTCVVLLWCWYRRKGSYVTNEVEDGMEDEGESLATDMALQRRE